MSNQLNTALVVALICVCCVKGYTIKHNVNVQKRSTNEKVDKPVLSLEREPTNHSNDVYDMSNDGNGTHKEHVSHDAHKMHVVSWQFEYVKSPFIIAVFLITAGIAKLGFHHANFLSSKVPESCLLIILGTVVGATLYGALPSDEENQPSLGAELFFLYLLPPIILESAYSLHDRTFYDNVGTVMIYAVLGTVLNCFLIGPSLYGIYLVGGMGETHMDMNFVQSLVFSAIIVAVDPVAVLAIFQEIGVNNTLYFLVFGESLFNDAVTVVLYNMMKTLNLMEEITPDQVVLGVVQFFVVSTGGLVIGIIFGAITAVLTKYTEHCRVVEPLAVFVLAYLSYLMAEMFHFSGIISIIGCGLTQAQYAFHNISRKSHTTVKYFGKMMSATCDCVIFMFLGISLFKKDVLTASHWHVGFIAWTIVFCLLYRFAVVFFLTFLINRTKRVRKIDMEEQFIMAYGGLRGAVAFSLVGVLDANNLPKGQFLTTTLIVIFFTVFIQGATIKPLVKLLRVRMEHQEKLQLGEEINIHVTDHVMAGIEEISGQRGEHYFREMLDHYNRKYLKMWLQRNPISSDEKIMQYFEKLALEQHFEHLAGSKMIIEKYGSETDLTEDVEQGSDYEIDSDVDESLPVIPIRAFDVDNEDISSELDNELLTRQTTSRRRALFPVALSKDVEKRLNENPTAEDIRKIMLPSRKQMNFKRLDRNLKTENSENDLLRYLQLRQMRTRRLSQTIVKPPALEGHAMDNNRMRLPRRSMAPVVVNNYRRRLSLAIPEGSAEYGRRRGVSAGNVLKGLDSPAKRRLRLRKGISSVSSEERSESTSMFPLTECINEDDTDDSDHVTVEFSPAADATKSTKLSRNKGARNSVINSRSKHGSLKRREPDSSEESYRGSFKGQASKQSALKGLRSPVQSAAKLQGKAVQFVSSKNSPSVHKRKPMTRSKTENVESAEEVPTHHVTSLPEINVDSGLRKNLSYSRALSADLLKPIEKEPSK